MYVVLDANAVVSEGFGASALLRFLLSSSKIVGHHIFIPELVVEEVVAKFERTIVVEADEAQRAVDQLSKRLTTPLPSPVTALDQQKEAAFVRARLQEQLGDVIVVDVRELTTGQALLRGHAKVDCCFNVVASKEDAYWLDEVLVEEPEWYEGYVLGGVNLQVRCGFDLTVDTSDSDHHRTEVLSMKLAVVEDDDSP